MHTRSLCILTASLVLSTALYGCGSASTGTQTIETEQDSASSEDAGAAATDTSVTEGEADAAAQSGAEQEADAAAQSGAEQEADAAAPAQADAAATKQKEPEPEPEPELPRSPLTGKVMDEELLKQRPLAVMYPINREAQPQYGLDRVDVFYEIMEEGDMSRQLGILQDWQGLDRIGNIRSIRSYFVYEALEWDPIIIHFGGPVDWVADDLTREDVDNINGVGGVMGPDYGAFYRIPHDGVAIEHTAYTDSEHINDAIEEAGFEREHREGYYKDKHFHRQRVSMRSAG